MLTNYADAASLAVGLVLPAIVAVFTKPSTNSTVKAVAHAVLAVATGALAVYKQDPSNFVWATAVVAAFLAWLSGTAFYHSLLKKYSWFAGLQNLFAAEAKIFLNTDGRQVETYFGIAQAAEATDDAAEIVNDFPLSTDLVQSGVEEAVHAAEEIPVVGEAVHKAETVAVPAIATFIDNTVPVQPQTGGLGPRAL
jgi:hypothetical protein